MKKIVFILIFIVPIILKGQDIELPRSYVKVIVIIESKGDYRIYNNGGYSDLKTKKIKKPLYYFFDYRLLDYMKQGYAMDIEIYKKNIFGKFKRINLDIIYKNKNAYLIIETNNDRKSKDLFKAHWTTKVLDINPKKLEFIGPPTHGCRRWL